MAVRSSHSVVGVFAAVAVFAFSTGAAAASGPTIVEGHRAGPFDLHGHLTFARVGSLAVPAGIWSISAKLDVVRLASHTRMAKCKLTAGGDYDLAQARLDTLFGGGRSNLTLLVTHAFSAPGQVHVHCLTDGQTGDVDGLSLRIQATKLNQLQVDDMAHGSSTTVGSGQPRMIAGYYDGPLDIPADNVAHTISLVAAYGAWAVSAKLIVDNPSTVTLHPECRLEADGDFDAISLSLPAGGIATVPLQLIHVFSSGTPFVTIGCNVGAHAGAHARARFVKIAALKAGSHVNVALPGSQTPGTTAPVVVAGYRDEANYFGGNGAYTTMGSLHVPTGRWAVVAKMSVISFPPGGVFRCEMALGGDLDATRGAVAANSYHGSGHISLSVTHDVRSAGGGNVVVRCSTINAGPYALKGFWLKITAVKAGSLSETAIT